MRKKHLVHSDKPISYVKGLNKRDRVDMVPHELITCLRDELHAVGKPEVGLGMFKLEKDVNELDIPGLAKRVQKAAPELWQLLSNLMEPRRSSHCDTLTKLKGNMVIISSILAYGRAPRRCINLPVLLGLHLHSIGVGQHTIDVLAGLGITSSYQTIKNKYDELAGIGKVCFPLHIYFLSLHETSGDMPSTANLCRNSSSSQHKFTAMRLLSPGTILTILGMIDIKHSMTL
jgi:hypothetical protein